MIGAGVASFSHVGGVHFQNASAWNEYIRLLNLNELPFDRAFPTTPEEQLIREMILQLKLGKIKTGYFREKFGGGHFGTVWFNLQKTER